MAPKRAPGGPKRARPAPSRRLHRLGYCRGAWPGRHRRRSTRGARCWSPTPRANSSCEATSRRAALRCTCQAGARGRRARGPRRPGVRCRWRRGRRRSTRPGRPRRPCRRWASGSACLLRRASSWSSSARRGPLRARWAPRRWRARRGGSGATRARWRTTTASCRGGCGGACTFMAQHSRRACWIRGGPLRTPALARAGSGRRSHCAVCPRGRGSGGGRGAGGGHGAGLAGPAARRPQQP